MVSSGSSFGANSLILELGIGDAGIIKELEIDWPVSGKKQIFKNVAVNNTVGVTEGIDKLNISKPAPFPFKKSDGKEDPIHQHNQLM